MRLKPQRARFFPIVTAPHCLHSMFPRSLYGCRHQQRFTLGRYVARCVDLNTPGTDGPQALVAIERDNAQKLCPVVVFSTSAASRNLAYCNAAGANAYQVKLGRYPNHLQRAIDPLTYRLRRVALPHLEGTES